MEEVGSYAAKTHLPSLLDKVAQGKSFTITRRGQPIARLIPIAEDRRKLAQEAAERILNRRKNLPKISLNEILESIHEGHKY